MLSFEQSQSEVCPAKRAAWFNFKPLHQALEMKGVVALNGRSQLSGPKFAQANHTLPKVTPFPNFSAELVSDRLPLLFLQGHVSKHSSEAPRQSLKLLLGKNLPAVIMIYQLLSQISPSLASRVDQAQTALKEVNKRKTSGRDYDLEQQQVGIYVDIEALVLKGEVLDKPINAKAI